MTIMRAKMVITEINKFESGQENLKMRAVCANRYPSDGVDEDNSFARWTPSASFEISIMNPDLWGKFEVGKKLYLDFSAAD